MFGVEFIDYLPPLKKGDFLNETHEIRYKAIMTLVKKKKVRVSNTIKVNDGKFVYYLTEIPSDSSNRISIVGSYASKNNYIVIGNSDNGKWFVDFRKIAPILDSPLNFRDSVFKFTFHYFEINEIETRESVEVRFPGNLIANISQPNTEIMRNDSIIDYLLRKGIVDYVVTVPRYIRSAGEIDHFDNLYNEVLKADEEYIIHIGGHEIRLRGLMIDDNFFLVQPPFFVVGHKNYGTVRFPIQSTRVIRFMHHTLSI